MATSKKKEEKNPSILTAEQAFLGIDAHIDAVGAYIGQVDALVKKINTQAAEIETTRDEKIKESLTAMLTTVYADGFITLFTIAQQMPELKLGDLRAFRDSLVVARKNDLDAFNKILKEETGKEISLETFSLLEGHLNTGRQQKQDELARAEEELTTIQYRMRVWALTGACSLVLFNQDITAAGGKPLGPDTIDYYLPKSGFSKLFGGMSKGDDYTRFRAQLKENNITDNAARDILTNIEEHKATSEHLATESLAAEEKIKQINDDIAGYDRVLDLIKEYADKLVDDSVLMAKVIDRLLPAFDSPAFCAEAQKTLNEKIPGALPADMLAASTKQSALLTLAAGLTALRADMVAYGQAFENIGRKLHDFPDHIDLNTLELHLDPARFADTVAHANDEAMRYLAASAAFLARVKTVDVTTSGLDAVEARALVMYNLLMTGGPFTKTENNKSAALVKNAAYTIDRLQAGGMTKLPAFLTLPTPTGDEYAPGDILSRRRGMIVDLDAAVEAAGVTASVMPKPEEKAPKKPAAKKTGTGLADKLKDAAASTPQKTYEIGEWVEGKGIYFGQCKRLGRTFNQFAAKGDIPRHNNYFNTVRLLISNKSPLLYGHGLAGFEYDHDLDRALSNGTYNGEWFIPTIEMLNGYNGDENFVSPDNLLAHKNTGAFKGSFNLSDRDNNGWYWSSTERDSDSMHNVRLQDGSTNGRGLKSGPAQLSCRLVRLEEVFDQAAAPKPANDSLAKTRRTAAADAATLMDIVSKYRRS